MSFGGGGGSGSKISTAGDVALSNTTDGDVLEYNGSLGKWQNATPTISSSLQSQIKGVCVYNSGTSSYPARPSGFGSIEWIGPVDPGASAQDGDTWVSTA